MGEGNASGVPWGDGRGNGDLGRLGGQTYAMQCKCYNPRHHVGLAVIRELVGSLPRYPNGTSGMVITTSDLTPRAKEEAERNGVL